MNRKDIDCNVIIDLLPLYKEEICSEATRELVEEHRRSCEYCRQLCENMTLPEPEHALNAARHLKLVASR